MASGVYGLSDAIQWIYIGETPNIQSVLLQHLQAPQGLLREHIPSGFTFELSPAEHRVERQHQLITELDPIGNRAARS
jgi:hypothetical protein